MEHPILMPDEGVRAILDGRKTQTRRVVQADRYSPWIPHMEDARADPGLGDGGYLHVPYTTDGDRVTRRVRCRYAIGDRLWVRETWCQQACMVHGDLLPGKAHYRADGYEVRHVDGPGKSPWRPSIHMPRWASRITLEVTAVRVERLQDITEEDARAEGVEPTVMVAAGVPEREVLVPAVGVYRNLWDRINGKRHPWASNPWVWVVSFRRAVA